MKTRTWSLVITFLAWITATCNAAPVSVSFNRPESPLPACDRWSYDRYNEEACIDANGLLKCNASRLECMNYQPLDVEVPGDVLVLPPRFLYVNGLFDRMFDKSKDPVLSGGIGTRRYFLHATKNVDSGPISHKYFTSGDAVGTCLETIGPDYWQGHIYARTSRLTRDIDNGEKDNMDTRDAWTHYWFHDQYVCLQPEVDGKLAGDGSGLPWGLGGFNQERSGRRENRLFFHVFTGSYPVREAEDRWQYFQDYQDPRRTREAGMSHMPEDGKAYWYSPRPAMKFHVMRNSVSNAPFATNYLAESKLSFYQLDRDECNIITHEDASGDDHRYNECFHNFAPVNNDGSRGRRDGRSMRYGGDFAYSPDEGGAFDIGNSMDYETRYWVGVEKEYLCGWYLSLTGLVNAWIPLAKATVRSIDAILTGTAPPRTPAEAVKILASALAGKKDVPVTADLRLSSYEWKTAFLQVAEDKGFLYYWAFSGSNIVPRWDECLTSVGSGTYDPTKCNVLHSHFSLYSRAGVQCNWDPRYNQLQCTNLRARRPTARLNETYEGYLDFDDIPVKDDLQVHFQRPPGGGGLYSDMPFTDNIAEGRETTRLGPSPTADGFLYPSWTMMDTYARVSNHVFNHVPKHRSRPVRMPYGKAQIWTMHTDPVVMAALKHVLPSKPESPEQAARLIADGYSGVDSDTPMGPCPLSCSLDDPLIAGDKAPSGQPKTFCNNDIGRCFCHPDSRRTGLGCEQTIPEQHSTPAGLKSTTCASLRAIGVDICSGAGECIDNDRVSGWPMCRCFSAFRGTPDKPNWKQVYASVFSARFDAWFGPGSEKLTARIEGVDLMWIDKTALGARARPSFVDKDNNVAYDAMDMNAFAIDWSHYIATHQCLVYKANYTEPPTRHFFVWNAYKYIKNDQSYIYNPALHDHRIYPWPYIFSVQGRGAFYRCADYKDTVLHKQDARLAALWERRLYVEGHLNRSQTLFGGTACVQCPDCSRIGSDACLDDPRDASLPAEQRRTFCKCKAGYSGPLCQFLSCAFSAGQFCGGKLKGACVVPFSADDRDASDAYFASNAGRFPPGSLTNSTIVANVTVGECVCRSGWSGRECLVNDCPVDSQDRVCGRVFVVTTNSSTTSVSGSLEDLTNNELPLNLSLSRGFCDVANQRCVCGDDWTGSDCSLPRCPVSRTSGLECNGLLDYATGLTVCDRTTRACQCWRAHNKNPSPNSYDGTYSNPQMDTSIYDQSFFGAACDIPFSSVCRSPEDDTWCGQSTAVGAPGSPRYAGCMMPLCADGRATDAGTDPAAYEKCGVTQAPKCYCRAGYFGSHCQSHVCGTFQCDEPLGLDTGDCKVSCGGTTSSCDMRKVSDGVPAAQMTGECVCKSTTIAGFLWTQNDTSLQSCDTQVPGTCVLNGRVCSGSDRGSCRLDTLVSLTYKCFCTAEWTGQYCETPNTCADATVAGCNTGNQLCRRGVCTCPANFFIDSSRSCDNNRCTATGGSSLSLDQEQCLCPDLLPMTRVTGIQFVTTTQQSLVLDRHKGCRKKCPVYARTGQECGDIALETFTPMCNDLIDDAPVWANSVTAKPTCRCGFLARMVDQTNAKVYMFWTSDGAGGCRPLCNLDNTEGVQLANPGGQPTPIPINSVLLTSPLNRAVPADTTFACKCKAGFEGQYCDLPKCNGGLARLINNNTGEFQCACTGTLWCKAGVGCSTDTCEPGGFCSQSETQSTTNADCNCRKPAYGLQLTSGLSRGRMCVSLCQNGGVPRRIDARTAVCDCVPGSGTSGTYCEVQRECNKDLYQYGGPNCDINLCQNGGLPFASEPGCLCPSPYLKGLLCNETDLCTLNNGAFRLLDYTCTCNPGWSKGSLIPNDPVNMTHGLCTTNLCGQFPNAPVDCRAENCAGGYTCNCVSGLTFNGYTCVPPANLSAFCDPRFGNITGNNVTGLFCTCLPGYGGGNCTQYLCGPREIPVASRACACRYPYEGPGCLSDICGANSLGPQAVVGTNGTILTDLLECGCIDGFRLTRSTEDGSVACVPDVYRCNPEGTVDWDPVVPRIPCVCLYDYVGTDCRQSRVAYEKEIAVAAEEEAIRLEEERANAASQRSFADEFVDAITFKGGSDYLFIVGGFAGVVVTLIAQQAIRYLRARGSPQSHAIN